MTTLILGNTTFGGSEHGQTQSVAHMAELALIGFFFSLVIVCTAFYICTRILRHKHLKELEEMKAESRNPLNMERAHSRNIASGTPKA